MKKGYTDITILLDRSGSMEKIQSDVIGGINTFLKDQKEIKGECRISLFQFDDKFQTDYEGIDVNLVSNLTEKTYEPRGNTALIGALGKTIDKVGKRLASLPESERPEKVILVVQTDGLENCSNYTEWAKAYTKTAVAEKIKHQTDKYQWQFLFLGANFDAVSEGSSYNISAINTITYAATSKGTNALYRSMSKNIADCRLGRKADISFTAEDKTEQEQILSDQ